MNIGKRSFSQFVGAVFSRQHYIALFNMFLVGVNPIECFARYFFGIGKYPRAIKLRTPLGIFAPIIYSYYDMLTINEIFFRKDYKTNQERKVIVDMGANIGISALYFLTRNKESRCYLFEPVLENTARLKENLKLFKNRYELQAAAIDIESGRKKFGLDQHGRCGGLKRESKNYIEVSCIDINKALEEALKENEFIDILKIDIEGNEIEVINSINKKYLEKIRNIYFEIDWTEDIKSGYSVLINSFSSKRYGNVFRLKKK